MLRMAMMVCDEERKICRGSFGSVPLPAVTYPSDINVAVPSPFSCFPATFKIKPIMDLTIDPFLILIL